MPLIASNEEEETVPRHPNPSLRISSGLLIPLWFWYVLFIVLYFYYSVVPLSQLIHIHIFFFSDSPWPVAPLCPVYIIFGRGLILKDRATRYEISTEERFLFHFSSITEQVLLFWITYRVSLWLVRQTTTDIFSDTIRFRWPAADLFLDTVILISASTDKP